MYCVLDREVVAEKERFVVWGELMDGFWSSSLPPLGIAGGHSTCTIIIILS